MSGFHDDEDIMDSDTVPDWGFGHGEKAEVKMGFPKMIK